MKPVLLILLLVTPLLAQKQKADPELVRLRDEYVRATKGYIASLDKLLVIYEYNVKLSDEKLETAKRQSAEGMMSRADVDSCARRLEIDKAKVQDVKQQILRADEQLKSIPTDEQLAVEYKKAVTKRRKSSSSPCRNWRLSAYRRETKGTITLSYTLVCDK